MSDENRSAAAKSLITLLLSILIGSAALLGKEAAVPAQELLVGFSLSIHEQRDEERIDPISNSPVPVEFESRIKLFGRFKILDGGKSITAYNDSIRFKTLKPFAFESVMSRDTLYYESQAGPNVVEKSEFAKYDSMLACIFEGPALKLQLQSEDSCCACSNEPPNICYDITDLKTNCESGQYSHIKPSLSLGVFFVRTPKASRWKQLAGIPTFSGLHFEPGICLAFRVVQKKPAGLTVVFTADTTLRDVEIHMPNGSTIAILEDKLHVGGTFIIDPATGFTQRGEVRIDERISFLRTGVSNRVGKKDCSYVLRLKTH